MDEDEEIIDVEIPIPPQAKRKEIQNGTDIPLPPGAILKKNENTPVPPIGGSGSKNGSISSQNIEGGLETATGEIIYPEEVREVTPTGDTELSMLGRSKAQPIGLELSDIVTTKKEPVELIPKAASSEQRIEVPAEKQFDVLQSKTNYAQLAEAFPNLQDAQNSADIFKGLEETEKAIHEGTFDISRNLPKPDLAAQSGQFISTALNLPEFANQNVQGILEGYDKAKEGLRMIGEAEGGLDKKYYEGLTGALLGGAHMGFSTVMNSPAGYAFIQGINADQIYSNGEVTNFLMTPISTIFPSQDGLTQNVTGLLDIVGNFAILGGVHAVMKGDKARGEKIKQGIEDFKAGKDLDGETTKLLAETVIEEATPQNIERIQETVKSIPEDVPKERVMPITEELLSIDPATLEKIPPTLHPETKIEVAPLIEEKQKLEKQKEKVDESFHPEIDKNIEEIKTEINEKIKSSGLRVRSIKPKTKEDAIQIEKGKIERFDEIKSDFSELIDMTELKKFTDTDSFLRNLETKGLITIEC